MSHKIECECCGCTISKKEDYGELDAAIYTWRGMGHRGVDFNEDGDSHISMDDVCVGCYMDIFREYKSRTGIDIDNLPTANKIRQKAEEIKDFILSILLGWVGIN